MASWLDDPDLNPAVSPAEYAAGQRAIADRAANDLLEWFREHPNPTNALLLDEYAQLHSLYGSASAELAIEYYASLRSQSEGLMVFEPTPFQGYPDSYIQKMITGKQAAKERQAADYDRWVHDTAGKLGRVVQQNGRATITRNAKRDPSQPKWARKPTGAKTCAWCLMLASQGAVYFTKESAGGGSTGGNWYHTGDDCQPVPVFNGQQPPYDADELYDLYLTSRANTGESSPSPERLAAQMRIDHPHLVSDAVDPHTH